MSERMPDPGYPWAKITNTPQTFKITRAAAQNGSYGKTEALIVLDNECQVTAWGRNYLYLYNSFGPDTANWIGKEVSIWKDDNGHRQFK